MKSIIFFILITIHFSIIAIVQKVEPKITWAVIDFPPGFILEGEHQGQGYGDLLNNFMIKHIKGYKHEISKFPNFARLKKELRRKDKNLICASTLFYEDIDKRVRSEIKQLYSAPNYVFFLHDLIINKSKRHLFPDSVSLKELLENQNLIFGYSRSTGHKSGKIIADYIGVNEDISSLPVIERIKALQAKDNIVVRLSSDIVTGPLRMLLKNRIDYILEYEFMVEFEAKRLGIEEQFISLPVKETMNDVSIGAFSCSNTADGKKVIAEINRILLRYRDSDEYKALLKYLIPKDETRNKQYWLEYEKIRGCN